MKKYMDALSKLDSKGLDKRAQELVTEIADTRRGVIAGEINNHQLIKAKRRELARVYTLKVSSPEEVKKIADKEQK